MKKSRYCNNNNNDCDNDDDDDNNNDNIEIFIAPSVSIEHMLYMYRSSSHFGNRRGEGPGDEVEVARASKKKIVIDSQHQFKGTLKLAFLVAQLNALISNLGEDGRCLFERALV